GAIRGSTAGRGQPSRLAEGGARAGSLVVLSFRPAGPGEGHGRSSLAGGAREAVRLMTFPPLGLLMAAALQAPPVFRAGGGRVGGEALGPGNGSPVRGLPGADFEVRDGGRVQALEPIREEKTPIDVVLVLDLSGSVGGGKLRALRVAADAFLDGLRPGANGLADGPDAERAALVVFQEEVRLLEPLTS